MSATFDDLRALKSAEEIADSIWKRVVQWDEFAKDVVGKQITRSADSIGANIADAKGLKTVRSENSNKKVVRESSSEYIVNDIELFSEEELIG